METKEKKRVSWHSLKQASRIFKFALPYKRQFIIGLVFLLLSSITVLLFPFLIGKLIDAAQGKAEWVIIDVDKITLIIAITLILQGLFSYARVIFFANVSEKAIADIRTQLYEKIITLPVTFFDNRRIGELVSRITSDVTTLQDTLSLTLAEFLRQVATLIIGVSFIAATAPTLTLLMLATYPLVIISVVIFGKFIRKLSKTTQDALADSNIIVEETFQSVNMVKAFTNEAFESKRFKSAIQRVVDFALRAAKYRALLISFIIVGVFGGITFVLWYGAHLVSNDMMTIGELTAFVLYTLFIGGSVGGMGEIYSKLQRTIGSSERLLDILEETSEVKIEPNDSVRSYIKLTGKIVFENVCFTYPSRKEVSVLTDINMDISTGQKVALVGPSGAGKSTITQLLLGFYSPESGSIKIDDRLIEDYDLPDLRNNIGIVPQEVILFGGTIKENIAYGKTNATDEELTEAAQKANALEFIETFPDGMETLVGERGVKLSGGQKQRIAIARAILKDPAILILDEATSSLDSASEILVQQALEKLMQNRTTIIIAHRLSTIRKVDTIYVLNHGEIIEQGNHDELLKDETGLYNHLINLQFDLSETS